MYILKPMMKDMPGALLNVYQYNRVAIQYSTQFDSLTFLKIVFSIKDNSLYSKIYLH